MFVRFLVFIIVTTVGYTINQGDFFQNEHIFIIAKTFLISLSVAYAKWFDMVSLRRLTKKEVLLFIGSFLLCVLVNIGYHNFFLQFLLVQDINTLRLLVQEFPYPLLRARQFLGLFWRNLFSEVSFKVRFLKILGWDLYWLPLSSLSCMLLMMFLHLSIIYLEVSCWALLIKRVKIYRWLF